MSVEHNKATLVRGAKAFNNLEDRSGWFDIHDPSVVAHGLAPAPLDFEGLRRFYDVLWTGFPDLQISVDDLIGDEDRVTWRISVRGTHQGEFRGVSATGKPVAFGAQYIFRFRDGKIVERWTNLDRLGVLIQLGAVAMPA